MIVGLTGGVGAGKSTVAAQFAAHGAHVIDADVVAREVVARGTPGLAAVVARFGASILTPEGDLDRAALAERVFSDGTARADLNAIVHPLVGRRSGELLAQAPRDCVVVYDVPLLVESGMAANFEKVVVVEADENVRIDRLQARGMPAEQARARIAAQATDAERRAIADFVIDNNGSIEDVRAAVDRVWRELVPVAA